MMKEKDSVESLNKKRDASFSKTETLRSSMNELNFDQDKYTALDEEKDNLSSSVDELSALVETLTASWEVVLPLIMRILCEASIVLK